MFRKRTAELPRCVSQPQNWNPIPLEVIALRSPRAAEAVRVCPFRRETERGYACTNPQIAAAQAQSELFLCLEDYRRENCTAAVLYDTAL